MHFMFECEGFNIERATLFNKVPELKTQTDNVERMIILSSMPYKLGNFLGEIWAKRNVLVVW